jgi:hypothetical protein
MVPKMGERKVTNGRRKPKIGENSYKNRGRGNARLRVRAL